MRVDIIFYDGISGYRTKETSHFSSRNIVENVGGDCRGEYSSKISHFSSHNPCGHSRLLHMTCSSPRRPLFLQMISFECTTKLYINFLNQFLV